jgi:hypothetical protein
MIGSIAFGFGIIAMRGTINYDLQTLILVPLKYMILFGAIAAPACYLLILLKCYTASFSKGFNGTEKRTSPSGAYIFFSKLRIVPMFARATTGMLIDSIVPN